MNINDLYKSFYNNYMLTRLRPSTVRGYLVNLKRHILPEIGDLELDDLTVELLDALTVTLREVHALSNKSIVYVHATLRKMMNYAMKRGYIYRNPYDSFDLPRVERYRYRVLSDSERRYMLEVCYGDPVLEAPIILALCYGLRRGECLGIIPELDLDQDHAILHIQRTRGVENGREVITPCKTDSGNRKILLDREHCDFFGRVAAVNAVLEDSDYLCPVTPSILDSQFARFLQKYDLPRMRFHDLRHSYATYMLSRGVNPKIVSGVLGHSDVAVTLDIYSHPDLSMQKVCLDVLHKK